jgi:hypothetical protein
MDKCRQQEIEVPMKGKSIFTLVLLMLSATSRFQAEEPQIRQIQCRVRPIDRARVHPSGSATFEQSTSPTSQTFSNNWSGFVAGADLSGSSGNGSVTYAAGEWVVPVLKPTPNNTFCSVWVGIDGWNNGTVEQIGTSHNWINGTQQNFAWFEMFPQGSNEITGFPVVNGDVISARVAYEGNNTFKLVIINHTQGVSTVIPNSFTMAPGVDRSSAEWVVESPSSGGILPLSDYQKVTFNYAQAIINGVHGLINDGSWMNDEITMVDSNGNVQSQPGGLLKGGSCFQVAWGAEN